MDMDYTMRPCDDLSEIEDIASFIAFTISTIGHHGSISDLSKQDCRGLSLIVTRLREQIGEVREDVAERLEQSALDALKKVGIPEEALANDAMRLAWRDGFSHGLAYSPKDQPLNGPSKPFDGVFRENAR
jgi:hypothetical protein